jgi:hypothetical protein
MAAEVMGVGAPAALLASSQVAFSEVESNLMAAVDKAAAVTEEALAT